jgi:catechol-2,3-dioxygenase
MLQVKRIGHATLTTPDLERQFDYDTRVVGLTAVATEKNRAILATKPGQEAIVLEHGDRPAGRHREPFRSRGYGWRRSDLQ